MLRRLILAFVLVALSTPFPGVPAFAAEEKKKDDPNAGLILDLAEVGLPVVQNGRLVNYVFTQVRLILPPGSNAIALQNKEPYFRDALVRAAHRTPFSIPGDNVHLDEAALKRVMAVEVARIAGPHAVASIQVMSETPQKTHGFQ